MAEINKLQELPIDLKIETIVSTFKSRLNLVLTASPGSGKTTRVPPALLKNLVSTGKKIIVLVPKRIAALSAASRIAEEQGYLLGHEVGFQVRFDNSTNENTQLIFMTEGVFIKKIADTQFWKDIEIIIFDEFHERSSNIDLALGICVEKQILGAKIKLLVMSATLDATKLINFLPDCALVEVETNIHPLHIIKSKKAQRLQCDHQFADTLIETLQEALSKCHRDILIFLPGLSEIKFIERQLSAKIKLPIHILHGSISLSEQQKILQNHSERRIILSTNIAESSLTVPSVDLVIDSGLEKKSVRETKIGFRRLETVRISQFSATQRAGRAARTSEGYCYQLWHEMDERSMPLQIEPEVLQSDLLEETLTLLRLEISNPQQFSWLDQPKKSFTATIDQLKKWELISEQMTITAKGRAVQSCPLDIERSLLFVELCSIGLQKEASRFIAYIETTAFDKLTEAINLHSLSLSDSGRKIESQLLRFGSYKTAENSTNLREAIIQIFFRHFSNKIAKKREKNLAVSSLGRGVELAAYLQSKENEYFILFSGRELSNALTYCDCAIGFTQTEFEKMSATEVNILKELHLDIEKRRIYVIERKQVGNFIIQESPKVYINEQQNPEVFIHFFEKNFLELMSAHHHYKNYVTKINFLKRKMTVLGLNDDSFNFLTIIHIEVQQNLADLVKSLDDFFSFDILSMLLLSTPENIKLLLKAMPESYTLHYGKTLEIDYLSEQAPKISGRLQDFFGQRTNPSLFNGKIRMTIELLAPNYRPTQVTSQLENFWTSSYHDIKKELKARYPKHAWPDDPINYKPLPKK